MQTKLYTYWKYTLSIQSVFISTQQLKKSMYWDENMELLSKLTHLPLDKMPITLADDNFRYIFLDENDRMNSDAIFTEICSQKSNWQ